MNFSNISLPEPFCWSPQSGFYWLKTSTKQPYAVFRTCGQQFSLTYWSRLNGALCTFAIGSNDIWKLIWGRRMLEDFIPKDICGVKMNVLSLWSLFRSGSRMMRQYWFVSHHKNFPVILSFHLAHQPWVIKIDRTLRLNDLTDVNFPNPDLMNGSDFLDHEFPKHMPDRRVECRTPAVASVKGARTARRKTGKPDRSGEPN